MPSRVSRIASHPLVASALILMAASANAADSVEAQRIKDLERRLEQSIRMIEELSVKVRQLENTRSLPSGPASAANKDSLDPRIEELQTKVNDLTLANSRRSTDEGLPVHGFADVGLGRSSEDNVDRNGIRRKGTKGFTLGTFDLYLAPQFGDSVKTLMELAFEIEENGDIAADLERLQIGYTFSDAATLWMGRFHTPYGYWNTAFHHGVQIQTSVTRPRFLDFEDRGGILPAHTTGAWVNGSLPFGTSKLGYDLFLGNAPNIRVDTGAGNVAGSLNMKMAGSGNHSSASGFNVSLRPGSAPDLTIGLHGLRASSVEDNLAAPNRTRLGILGGYAAFSNDVWEVMGEAYRFRNRDLSGASGTHASSAWYLQLARTFGRATPFARLERTSLDQTDNYFLAQESGRSYSRAVVGTRYDLNPKAAIKFELNRTRQDDTGGPGLSLRDSYTEARIQYAIRF